MISGISLSELAHRTGGELFGDDCFADAVSIDSRQAEGALFIAIKGARLDGHDYISDAVSAGCSAVVAQHYQDVPCALLVVSDSLAALGHAGAMNRELFDGPVIALTGSAGKTTTKNMLAAILSQRATVTATLANHNNEIGVPLTLLNIAQDTEFSVVEMGARHLGDIRYLSGFVQPDIAVVLNAGSAHIGEFGGYQSIVDTKGELYDSLRSDGTAIVNLDDAAASQWIQRIATRRSISFGVTSRDADVRALNVRSTSGGSLVVLRYQGQDHEVFIPVPGKHNVMNALAAAAAALAAGLSLAEISDGLALAEPVSGRLKETKLKNGALVIDDSYNANPVSVKAALDVLMLHKGLHVAVLGEMAELGDSAESMHVAVAEHARAVGVDRLYCCGLFGSAMASEFGDGAVSFDSKEALAASLAGSLTGAEVVLVKGSRSAGMEDVVKYMSGGLH